MTNLLDSLNAAAAGNECPHVGGVAAGVYGMAAGGKFFDPAARLVLCLNKALLPLSKRPRLFHTIPIINPAHPGQNEARKEG